MGHEKDTTPGQQPVYAPSLAMHADRLKERQVHAQQQETPLKPPVGPWQQSADIAKDKANQSKPSTAEIVGSISLGTVVVGVSAPYTLPLLLPISFTVGSYMIAESTLAPAYHQVSSLFCSLAGYVLDPSSEQLQTDRLRSMFVIHMAEVLGVLYQFGLEDEQSIQAKLSQTQVSDDILALTSLQCAYMSMHLNDQKLLMVQGQTLDISQCPDVYKSIFNRLVSLRNELVKVMPKEDIPNQYCQRYIPYILNQYRESQEQLLVEQLSPLEVANLRLVQNHVAEIVKEVKRDFPDGLRINAEYLRQFCSQLNKHYISPQRQQTPVRLCDVFAFKAELDRQQRGGSGPAFPVMRK